MLATYLAIALISLSQSEPPQAQTGVQPTLESKASDAQNPNRENTLFLLPGASAPPEAIEVAVNVVFFAGDKDPDEFSERNMDASLQQLTSFPALKYVNVGVGKVTPEGLAHLAKVKTLRALNLSGCGLTDDCLIYLSRMHALSWARLSNNEGITDAGLANLVKSKSIVELDLSASGISNRAFTFLKKMPLTHLDVSANKLNDFDVRPLVEMKSLRDLDLSYTDVSDASLEILKSMPHLRQLSLIQAKMSRAGFEQLRQSLPDTLIYGDGDTSRTQRPN